jgi:hypothetical protein
MLRRSFKSLVLIILGLFVFTIAVCPQQVQIKKCSMNNTDIADKYYTEKKFYDFKANLSVAIQSENDGLRKSAIYLAGFYSLKEVVPVLVNQLEKEKNSDIKILIALTLYRIGDLSGMEAVEKLLTTNNDMRVKQISKTILKEYENKFLTAKVSKG